MRRLTFFLVLISIFLANGTLIAQPMQLEDIALIPKPVRIQSEDGRFDLTRKATIYLSQDSGELMELARYLKSRIEPATGKVFKVKTRFKAPSRGIYLKLGAVADSLGSEGYILTSTTEVLTIASSTVRGLFYGIQTLRQLLPATIESPVQQAENWSIPNGQIVDYPRFEYRGTMLDIARHFFGVEDLKRHIDLIAAFKLNKLHLHLSDDQGWRIEIKSWPNLTKHGGLLEVGGTPGGFLTQEEFKEVVDYAKSRFVEVIPEIDMPGHTNAALSAYPELNCSGEAPELYTGTKVGFSTLCTDKELTYEFLDDVIREISAISPSPYFHIGGDESLVTPLEAYIPFIERTQEIVRKYGKKLIGWEEIGQAKLDSTSVIQYWSKGKTAKKGIDQGAKVLVSKAQNAYLDMKYNKDSPIGINWAGLIDVEQAYNWDPLGLDTVLTAENVLGVEAPLWTETVKTMDDIEFLAFPRLMGYAEMAWSPQRHRNWFAYSQRLGQFANRLNILQINYYPSPLIPWEK